MSIVLAIVNAWRPSFTRLRQVTDFGTNPGALEMLTFVPDVLAPRPACLLFFMAHYSRRPITTAEQAGRPLQINMGSLF